MKKIKIIFFLLLTLSISSCAIITRQNDENILLIKNTIDDNNNLYNTMLFSKKYSWESNTENYLKVQNDFDKLNVYNKSLKNNQDLNSIVELLNKKWSSYVKEHETLKILNEGQILVFKREMNDALIEVYKSELSKPKNK